MDAQSEGGGFSTDLDLQVVTQKGELLFNLFSASLGSTSENESLNELGNTGGFQSFLSSTSLDNNGNGSEMRSGRRFNSNSNTVSQGFNSESSIVLESSGDFSLRKLTEVSQTGLAELESFASDDVALRLLLEGGESSL